MLFFTAQLIQDMFGMCEVKPELANRRPKGVRKDSQRTEGDGLTYQNHTEPENGPRWFVIVTSLERPQNVVWEGALEQDVKSEAQAPIEQQHDTRPAPPQPKHLSKPVQTLAVEHATLEVPTLYTIFHQTWRYRRIIGESGDGRVHQFQRRKRRNEYVAVEVSQSSSAREDSKQEVMNLRRIGPHEHILALLRVIPEWIPYGPALMFSYCEMGDLTKYRESWCAQQKSQGLPERVSEITMCKLFRDTALALDHLHNSLGTCYIYNDLKPHNILVFLPDEYAEKDRQPEKPVFEVSDFARLVLWPTPIGRRPKGFDGTFEYAPPNPERAAPVLRSADVWSLGATLQYMALGITPVQSRKAFIWSRKGTGKS